MTVRENTPLAETKIVHDRFYIMQMASDAPDKVRRAEHKAIKSNGYDTLTGTRSVWLTAFERLPERQQEHFAAVMDSGLEITKA